MKIRIAGTGLYLPPKIQKSEELAKMIDKSAEWIKKKSGVEERRVSSIDVDKMDRWIDGWMDGWMDRWMDG